VNFIILLQCLDQAGRGVLSTAKNDDCAFHKSTFWLGPFPMHIRAAGLCPLLSGYSVAGLSLTLLGFMTHMGMLSEMLATA
jgi:hypothetical protein